MKKIGTISEAILILCEALKDESYYLAWQANIAIAFQDEFQKWLGTKHLEGTPINEISNNAARRFLASLMEAGK